MQTELSLAQEIHAALIPPIEKATPRLELYGRSVAGAEMGGDLIDMVERDGQTDVFIADVSGHGVKAGVIMAVVKSAIRTRLASPLTKGGPTGVECDDALGNLFADVNRVVCELAGPGMFVTAACLRFRTEGQALFCGAGHGPILHFRAAIGDLSPLESEHLPLGVISDESFAARTVRAEHGDVFLLMTDGLTEVFDAEGRMLSQQPIEVLLREHARRPLGELYETIMSAVRSHGPQADDQTLLLVRVGPRDGAPASV
jgi:sigma-B regulation protein RsbU (phosphoserine phosphatase)